LTTVFSSTTWQITEEYQIWKQQQTGDHLPVIYSTIAPRAIASLVAAYYEIDVPKDCQLWHRGLSDVYWLETLSSVYIVRVSHHHWRTKTEIDFELELLEHLAESEIPVAAPLRTRDDRLLVEIKAPEGLRYISLFPYAPGTVALGDLNSHQSRLLGQTVARLHQVARNFKPLAYRQTLDLKYLLEDSLQIIAPFLLQRQQDLQFLVCAIVEIQQQLQSLPKTSPYWGICWGDPHSGNVHFAGEDRMTLFDFDQCGYGWRAFDLGKFFQVSLQTGLSRTVRDAFVEGYEAIEPLTDAEYHSLQALTQTAYIWSWSIHLSNTQLHDYSRLDYSYFTYRLGILKRLRSKDWQLF
jgi:Ser/Thr protein kinase RdoA (MazF antagonist)